MNNPKTKTASFLRIGRTAAILCLGAFVVATQGFAQGASGGSPVQSANPLPLSGRAGQSGSVTTVEAPIAGTTNSVNTINPTVQVQGAYTGSAVSTAKMPFSGKLSLRDAIERGLNYNLGAVGLGHAARQAQGQSQVARSALLPNLSGYLTEVVQQTDLAAEGFNFKLPGFAIPSVVGPFNYFDLRGSLTQSVVDLTAWNNYRSSHEVYRAAQFAARDARDLVVLAVCGAYLQVISTKERVKSAHAQFETANALYQQALDKLHVGLAAKVDADRSEVEALAQQQRVISLDTELAKQKINLTRMTGLPPNDDYDITDNVPYQAQNS